MANNNNTIIIGNIHRIRFIIELRLGCFLIAHEHCVSFSSPTYVKNAYASIINNTKYIIDSHLNEVDFKLNQNRPTNVRNMIIKHIAFIKLCRQSRTQLQSASSKLYM